MSRASTVISLLEQNALDEHFSLFEGTAGLNLEIISAKDGVLKAKINGIQYTYTTKDIDAEVLGPKVKKMAGFSSGKALAYLKKHVAGHMKEQPGSIGEAVELDENSDWSIHNRMLKAAGYDLHPKHVKDPLSTSKSKPQATHYKSDSSNGEHHLNIDIHDDNNHYATFTRLKNNPGKSGVYMVRKLPTVKSQLPTKATPVQKAQPIATDAQIKGIIWEIISEMKNKNPARYPTSTDQQPEKNGAGFSQSIRYWGNWEVPEGEEDDGDYDWEVLTFKSQSVLHHLIEGFRSKYKDFRIEYSPEEKRYISIWVGPKK